MEGLKPILAVLLLGAVVWVGSHLLDGFRKAEGTVKERFLAAFRHSESLMWADFLAVVGTAGVLIDQGSDLLASPELRDFITAWIPEAQMKVLAFIGLISRFLRLYRTKPEDFEQKDRGP